MDRIINEDGSILPLPDGGGGGGLLINPAILWIAGFISNKN
jgi:hypothetical protein